jgi:hypothetical protein
VQVKSRNRARIYEYLPFPSVRSNTSRLFLAVSFILVAALLGACGHSTSRYRVKSLAWQNDSAVFSLVEKGELEKRFPLKEMDVNCLSCNLVTDEIDVKIDSNGNGGIVIPETMQLITTRFRVHAHGLDTTIIVRQRSPQDAQRIYHLKDSLIGRVMTTQLALLYADTTQEKVITTVDRGDELNIFKEHEMFFEVHHPRYSTPLYLLKRSAVRLY